MHDKTEHTILFKDLGRMDYKQAWDLQEDSLDRVVRQKLEKKAEDQVVYFCEHPHVYTIGKSGKDQNILITDAVLNKINASLYKIDRGGDITYHGPGQIVGYPIIDLEAIGVSVKEYVWKLEESVIQTLGEYDLKAERLDGATGVWLDTDNPIKTRKICAIGVRVSRYVTMHGFALNVNTDLRYFEYINPCGFTDKGVTSMQKELDRELDLEEVSKVLKSRFSEVFEVTLLTKR